MPGGEEETNPGLHQFERNQYFYGKLMTVRDFEDERAYLNGKRYLVNRVLPGIFRGPRPSAEGFPSAGNRLFLSKCQSAALREIATAVRAARARWRAGVYDAWGFAGRSSRGRGISVIFTGPNGTGKTMAAAILAADLNLELYRIDLSGVVSKYIGETEKNLRRLFATAEDGGAILLFDEADALFGKRSEVEDSHDRYACTDVHPLFRIMEDYHRLTILSVKDERALNPACISRIRYTVRFPAK